MYINVLYGKCDVSFLAFPKLQCKAYMYTQYAFIDQVLDVGLVRFLFSLFLHFYVQRLVQ